MIKILIVEDEPSILNVLTVSLQSQGYSVMQATSVAAGLKQAIDFHPQLIILDIGLPDGSGADLLKKVREWSNVPILVLTVDDSESTKVALLEGGADDYITKPFSMPEVSARIKVALRHKLTDGANPVFSSGDLYVDLAQHIVTVRGERVHLTATEYEILRLLIRNGGQVIPQDQILSEIWGVIGKDNPHYARIYIGQLRKKIEADPSAPKYILTEPGIGYRIQPSK